jgi:hypothetical protein
MLKYPRPIFTDCISKLETEAGKDGQRQIWTDRQMERQTGERETGQRDRERERERTKHELTYITYIKTTSFCLGTNHLQVHPHAHRTEASPLLDFHSQREDLGLD